MHRVSEIKKLPLRAATNAANGAAQQSNEKIPLNHTAYSRPPKVALP
jgi:hypothetical protein